MRHTVVLFVILTFSLTCFASVAAPTAYTIGFAEDDLSSDWRAAQMLQIETTIANYPNVRFLKADSNGSIAQNILDIEIMVKQGAQILFLAPRNPDAVQPLIKNIRNRGVKIVLLTRKLNSDDYDVYIGPDDFKIATDAANLIAKRIDGSGVVLMLEGIRSTTTSITRTDGFLSGMKAYPGIRVVRAVANYSRSEAIVAVETAIRSGHKFNAIFAQNDAMATGAILALKNAGFTPSKTPIVGIDFLPETRKFILAGEQFASFTYPICGKEGVKAALDLLQGKTNVPRHISISSQLVTKENVATVSPTF